MTFPHLSVLLALVLGACKTTQISRSSSLEANTPRVLPPKAQQLWDQYVQQVNAQGDVQENCKPIQLLPNPEREPKGLVLMYHGYTGCSIQFINSGRTLADMGYHVLFPLLPGQGLKPLSIDRQRRQVNDNISRLPRSPEPYYQLARQMNAIAAEVPGYRFVGGISGGGSMTIGSLVEGVDPHTGQNIWHRTLLFVPLIKLPGIQGNLSELINFFNPQFYAGFGQSCDDDQLSETLPRNGICDFEVSQIQAIESFGRQVAERAAEIRIPLQLVGVEKDGAADNTAMGKFFDQVQSAEKSICYYPEGVNHAILYEGDYQTLATRPWAPEVEAKLIRYIDEGRFYEASQRSKAERQRPLCDLEAALPNRQK